MPKIYEYFGLIFLFYANDHKPVHVHVKNGEYQNKLEFVYEKGKLKHVLVKAIKGKKGLSESMIKVALKFVKAKEHEISQKWLDFFAKGKKIVCEKITKKL